MAKKTGLASVRGLLNFVLWLTGILVSLAVGFGMVDGTLNIPQVVSVVTSTAGWIIVVLKVLGAVLAIIEKISK